MIAASTDHLHLAPRAQRLLVAPADTSSAGPMVEGLLHSGHQIIGTASTAEEALRMTRAVHPELLLLDEALADASGYEACRRLRSELAGMPIILLIARDSAADRTRGAPHGRRRLPQPDRGSGGAGTPGFGRAAPQCNPAT